MCSIITNDQISQANSSKILNYVLFFNNQLWSLILTCFDFFFIYIEQGMGLLTLYAPTRQNGQTLSNNLSGKDDELFECVWPFCEVDA